MRATPRIAGDAFLVVLGVAVLAGAVYTVRHSASVSGTAVLSSTASSAARPVVAGTPSPVPRATGPTTAARTVVVLAGPDLAAVRGPLAASTGDTVYTVEGAPPEVLAPGALDTVPTAPDAVVLQVQPGSKTTTRTSTAVAAVAAQWPDARVVVVGPFSSNDRKSAAAASSAAGTAHVTFLDPVLLHWRATDSTGTLSARDVRVVSTRLAAALA